MAKQSAAMRVQCQGRLHRGESGRCANAGTWGLYTWSRGETDVNLDKPVAVLCGACKAKYRIDGHRLRFVKLKTL